MEISKEIKDSINNLYDIKSNLYGYFYMLFSNSFNEDFIGVSNIIYSTIEVLKDNINHKYSHDLEIALTLLQRAITLEEDCISQESKQAYINEIKNQYNSIFIKEKNINEIASIENKQLRIILEKDYEWNELLNDYKGDIQELRNNNRRIEDFISIELLFIHKISEIIKNSIYTESDYSLITNMKAQLEFLKVSTLYWTTLFKNVIKEKSKDVNNNLFLAGAILLEIFANFDSISLDFYINKADL